MDPCSGLQEHLGALATNLRAYGSTGDILESTWEARATSVGARRSTVELPGNNNIFFGNTAGAPGNRLREKTQLLLVVERF
jgi:hypothetical protein